MKNVFFLIGLTLCLILLWPLFKAPYFSHHDELEVIRLFEMNKCFQDLQIPCRWVPDLGGLYGYPLFNYYGPLPYYYGELIYFLTKNLLVSVKIMFAASFIGSYIFMYLLGRKIWGQLGGSLSAIFYTFAPYHAVDFYVRGAMGEMWGLTLLPALLWAVIRLNEVTNVFNLAITSLFIAFLILAHNLSAFIFLPILSIFVVVIFLKNRKKKFLYYSFAALILGLLLSSFYFLPAIFEKDLVHLDSLTSGYFGYTEHFKGLKRLFLDYSWGYGSSLREVPGGEKDNLSYQVGIIHTFVFLLSFLVVKLLWKRGKELTIPIIFFQVVTLTSIFMIHPRSDLVWKLIEPLKYLQFPWRFLIIVIFAISLISGCVLLLTKNAKQKIIFWVALVCLIFIANFSFFKPEKFIYITDQELLSGKNWDKQIKRSIFDYLPIFAKEPPVELATTRYDILTGDAQVSDFKEGTNWISFKIDTKGHTIIRLSQYYFPEWKIKVNNEEIKFNYKNNHLGLMNFILGKGSYKVEARLFDTPIRKIANILTIIAFLITLILLVFQIKLLRKWFLYYLRAIH